MKSSIFLLVLTVGFSGCTASLGPHLIPRERFDYNQHLIGSQNQQMLLNLVRLRYNDTPLFLELNNIVAQYTMERRASLSFAAAIRHASGLRPLATTEPAMSGGLTFVERPTVSYAPLQGEDFARQILTPIPPETIVLLSQSGWSIARLLRLCVQRMNGIVNAETAAGPTPAEKPVYEDFQTVTNLLRTLQQSGILVVDTVEQAGRWSAQIRLRPRPGEALEGREDVALIRRMLGLPPEKKEYRISVSQHQADAGEIILATRSLLGVLFFLSQSVESPPEHQEKQLVGVTRDEFGNPFDWSAVLGNLMQIRSQKEPPDNFYVSVYYRGYWFYIQDTDLNSKATFNLLAYLFALQSAEGKEFLLF